MCKGKSVWIYTNNMEMSIFILCNNFKPQYILSILHKNTSKLGNRSLDLKIKIPNLWGKLDFLKWHFLSSLVSDTNALTAKPTSGLIKANRCLSSQKKKRHFLWRVSSWLLSFSSSLTRAILRMVRDGKGCDRRPTPVAYRERKCPIWLW